MDTMYAKTAANWETSQAIEWPLFRKAFAEYLREVIATFSAKNPDAVVYGIVIVRGQNWDLSVYLNTEHGYATMPARFRKQCSNGPPKTDAEILASLGRWYYEAWEFDLYEFQCRPEVQALNDLHYEVFDRLNDVDWEQNGTPDVSELFLHACAEAIAGLQDSAELHALKRTPDFQIRLFDANVHEWNTAALMAQAHQRVTALQA